MTEIKLSNSSSPQKGAMEGQKARDLAIPRAFEEYQREADKKPKSHLVIISDSEDEARPVIIKPASVGLEPGNRGSQTGGNSIIHYLYHKFTPAQATPGRRGKWNAYVVYSGRAPYVYRGWQGVRQLKDEDNNLVYKGFNDFTSATQAWKAAHDTGVVDAIQKGQGRTHWVVTKGIEPGTYRHPYDALRDGLGWGGGVLHAFSNEQEAIEFWNREVNARRIIHVDDPGFF
ncbi:hypothetical protein DFH05DRAFT_1458286 [Lentinula detonsa]|uniref:Ribonuclease H1 N-terminal domain-containing protein n=1 Tax=Lentinula detonsa TaxID=2804962 RepID=A0A9W8P6Y2_9AGAR|nr:hypothetical protein DFH05DRAFT_1458286 [Lentinula detonsa]